MGSALPIRNHRHAIAFYLVMAVAGCAKKLPPAGQLPTESGESSADGMLTGGSYARSNEQLKLLASKALCSPEVRSLIKLIEHECGVRECKAEDLRVLARQIEPRQRFMWLMRDIPHVVVYLKENSAALPAQTAIVEERQYNLRRLLTPPWFDFSQIWIVAHSSVKETNKDFSALERAEKVRQLILNLRFGKSQQRFPASHILKLSYDFPLVAPVGRLQSLGAEKNEVSATLELLNKNILLKSDMPSYGEPPDVSRGVWVFLIDCVGAP